ncbi:uncharacterized protein LOC141640175 [Silene latifolia]|uniref:uncharacterized protein LOC141640175 n=1 Tax=Silene latifolia TaxID=37657 RepID=UPI003D7743CE
MGCITSSWFSLKINEFVHGFFQGKSGLTQGDPLSPYLFILAMEILSRYLRKICTSPNVSYHPKCTKLGLTHLIFADDLMIFTKGDVPSITAVLQVLESFSTWSRLYANTEKTEIYFGGVSAAIRQQILQGIGFSEGKFPFRYLVLPLATARITVDSYGVLLNKIQSYLQHWATRFFSYVGKVQLLNSVIFGLTNFWCATALLPKNIIKALNKLCKDICRSIEDGKRRLIFKSWKSICSPWQEGGFNMKELFSWNKALLDKWLWILEVKKSGLWFEWTQAYHLTNSSIWTLQSKSHYTESLRSILIIRDELLSKTGSTTAAVSLLESWFHNGKLVSVRLILGKGLAIINRCILCKQDNGTHSHLFFNYDFSSKIWDGIQRWLKISGRSYDAESELLWCSDRRHGRHWKNGWLRDSIAETCYYIWDERNSRVFNGLERTAEQLLHVIRVTVSSRILSKISCLHYEMGAGRLNLVSI